MKRIFCLITAFFAVVLLILPAAADTAASDNKAVEGLWCLEEYTLDTLWGRYHAACNATRATLEKDGTLQLADMTFTPVGEGVYLGHTEAGILTVRFEADEEGTLTAAVFSDGRVLRPLPVYYDMRIVMPALAAVALLSLWFILSGAAVAVWSVFYREPNGRRRSVFYLLPHVFAALQSLVILPQTAMVFFVKFDLAPIYRWLSVAALFLGLAATVFYIVAFLRSFFRRSLHHRIAYSAIAFVALQILLRLFAIVPMP